MRALSSLSLSLSALAFSRSLSISPSLAAAFFLFLRSRFLCTYLVSLSHALVRSLLYIVLACSTVCISISLSPSVAISLWLFRSFSLARSRSHVRPLSSLSALSLSPGERTLSPYPGCNVLVRTSQERVPPSPERVPGVGLQ
jgi:hypothetical protein